MLRWQFYAAYIATVALLSWLAMLAYGALRPEVPHWPYWLWVAAAIGWVGVLAVGGRLWRLVRGDRRG